MIPRTFLSTYAANGQQQMAVKFLTDITGLKRWADYIPVKLTQGGSENTYANNGFIDVVSVTVTSTMRPFAEYVPVYVDSSATDAWQVNATGYIPYGYAGFGGANMVLDFTNGSSLDSRITFTRASTATRTNPSGVIESVAINGARFDYDPVTLAPKGLLIEEQRTNLVLRSEEFDNASWTKTNSSVSANSVTSPDGTADADTITETSATGSHRVRTASISVSASTSYTCTVYAKLGVGSVRYLGIGLSSTTDLTTAARRSYVFDLSNGTATTTGGATWTVVSGSATAVGNGWYRCQMTVTTDAAASTMFVSIGLSDTFSAATFASGYTGDGTSGVYIWGAQLEAGAFATTYIPTVASQVTRSADVAVMTGTNFSSWYSATEGSMYAQYDWLGDSSFDYMFAINDTTGNNLIGIGLSNANIYRGIVVTSGTTVASMTAGGVGVIGQVYSQAMAYKLNDFALAGGGVMRGTDTAGAVPVVTQASFNGSSGISNLFNGHIRRIAYYPTRLTNAQLQSLTS